MFVLQNPPREWSDVECDKFSISCSFPIFLSFFYFSGIDSGTLRCILHHLISLGPQVLELVGKNRSFLMFKLFWSTCVALASSDILNDHITLLKAAAQWLSTRLADIRACGPLLQSGKSLWASILVS